MANSIKSRWLENWWMPLIVTIISGGILTFFSMFMGNNSDASNTQDISNTQNNGVIANQIHGNVINGDVTILPQEIEKDNRTMNIRDEVTKGFNAIDTVKNYFKYLNGGEYKKACSLLSLATCDTNNQGSILSISREKENTINGYENIQTIDSKRDSGNKKIICTKFSYKLNMNSNGAIRYFIQFHLEKKEGIREITRRIPEKSFQEGRGERTLEKKASEIICFGKVLPE